MQAISATKYTNFHSSIHPISLTVSLVPKSPTHGMQGCRNLSHKSISVRVKSNCYRAEMVLSKDNVTERDSSSVTIGVLVERPDGSLLTFAQDDVVSCSILIHLITKRDTLRPFRRQRFLCSLSNMTPVTLLFFIKYDPSHSFSRIKLTSVIFSRKPPSCILIA